MSYLNNIKSDTFSKVINFLFQGAQEVNYFSSVTALVPLFENAESSLLNTIGSHQKIIKFDSIDYGFARHTR